jgi:hypothetical protein
MYFTEASKAAKIQAEATIDVFAAGAAGMYACMHDLCMFLCIKCVCRLSAGAAV